MVLMSSPRPRVLGAERGEGLISSARDMEIEQDMSLSFHQAALGDAASPRARWPLPALGEENSLAMSGSQRQKMANLQCGEQPEAARLSPGTPHPLLSCSF